MDPEVKLLSSPPVTLVVIPHRKSHIQMTANTKHVTLLWLECGHQFHPESFRVLCVETESIRGVFYDYDGNGESLAFAYDQKQQSQAPGESIPSIPDHYEKHLLREAAATYTNRISNR